MKGWVNYEPISSNYVNEYDITRKWRGKPDVEYEVTGIRQHERRENDKIWR